MPPPCNLVPPVVAWVAMSPIRSPRCVVLGLVLLGSATAPAWAAAASVTEMPFPAAATVSLAPGITYQRAVLARGQVIHIIRVSPHGLATLDPIAVSGVTGARADLAQATRQQTPAGAVASVNGDFFNFEQAYPSGLTITRRAGLVSTPNPLRSSLLIGPSGALSVQRAVLSGSWAAIAGNGTDIGSPGSIAGINRPAVHASEVILFTPGFGAAIAGLPAHLPAGATGPTPTTEDSATIVPDAAGPLAANSVITGTVVANSSGRSVRIPPAGLVVTGIGPAGAAIATRLRPGARVSVSIRIAGIAAGALAIGGGPTLVVGGRPIHNAGEGFTANQLVVRSQRTAIGQTAGGTDVLVSAEGPGEGSPGITVPQQADLMARLGARVAVAMDSGGSSQMIVGGADVMPWPHPRAISTAVVVRYAGVRIAPLAAPISPNHDGIDDRVSVPVVVPSPGTLRVTLTAAHRAPIALFAGAVPAVPMSVAIDPLRLGIPDGTYRLDASLTPVLGTASSDHQRVVIDRTLGNLHSRPFLRGGQPAEHIDFRLARSATVTIRLSTRAGRTLGVIVAPRRLTPGHHTIAWNQRIGRLVFSGGVAITAVATTRFGTDGLVARVVLPRQRRRVH